ncbi:unnamed protein product [Meloidogyne enterolobii]|uniref:Uncharacterized protein n=1 Tax=Meloidogyne enterolobii TaxID=390850 RepID=A0ACB1AE24_MELEN
MHYERNTRNWCLMNLLPNISANLMISLTTVTIFRVVLLFDLFCAFDNLNPERFIIPYFIIPCPQNPSKHQAAF